MSAVLAFILSFLFLFMPSGLVFAQSASEAASVDESLWDRPAPKVLPEPNIGPWVLAGAGIASLGVGLTLFLVAHNEYDDLAQPVRDSDGRIRGVTQREVAREEQEIANRVRTGSILMGLGVLVGAGGVLWHLFETDEPMPVGPLETVPVQPFGWYGFTSAKGAPLGLGCRGRF